MQYARKQTYKEEFIQIGEESQSPQFIQDYTNNIQGINLPVKKKKKKKKKHENKDSYTEDAKDILQCRFRTFTDD